MISSPRTNKGGMSCRVVTGTGNTNFTAYRALRVLDHKESRQSQ